MSTKKVILKNEHLKKYLEQIKSLEIKKNTKFNLELKEGYDLNYTINCVNLLPFNLINSILMEKSFQKNLLLF